MLWQRYFSTSGLTPATSLTTGSVPWGIFTNSVWNMICHKKCLTKRKILISILFYLWRMVPWILDSSSPIKTHSQNQEMFLGIYLKIQLCLEGCRIHIVAIITTLEVWMEIWNCSSCNIPLQQTLRHDNQVEILGWSF